MNYKELQRLNEIVENLRDRMIEEKVSDKDFVLELLQRDYFIDEFMIIYDWINNDLWNDKDFVLKVLNINQLLLFHL